MKRTACVVAGTLVLVLGACAPQRDLGTVLPTLDAPESYTAEHPGAGQAEALEATWWRAFASPELNGFVGEALTHNYDLKMAAASVDAAAAQARIAGSALWPSLSASGTATRRKQNFIGFPGPGGSEEVFSSTSTTYGVSMNLNWEVDLWGRLRQGRRAGVAAAQAALADYAGAQLSLAAQVSKAWFAAVESGRQLRLAQATVESWQETAQQTEARYNRGLADPLTLRQARSNLASAEAARHGAEIQSLAARRQLETLLRRYPGATLDVAEDLPAVTGTVPAGIPADLLSRRPDLAAAERRLIAAGAQVASNKAALYPVINLTASAGTTSPEFADLLDGDFSVWSIAGMITQPLFQGGRLRANVKQAEAGEEQAWNAFGSAVLRALQDVETALDNERLLEEQEQALARASREANQALELARDQYGRGVISFINLLEAQRAAVEFESRYLSAQRRRLEGRVDLYVALGGGFSATEGASSTTETMP